jgi:hypothetical protein
MEVEKLDTFTGEESSIHRYPKKGWTTFPYKFEGCASLLRRLSPLNSSISSIAPTPSLSDPYITTSYAPIHLQNIILCESNVLLVDYAEYKLPTSATPDTWSAPTEILRIDNEIRSHLEIPLRG